MTTLRWQTVRKDPQIPRGNITKFLDGKLLVRLPKSRKIDVRLRILTIADNYSGYELYAVSVLAYAFKAGRFDEFASRLERNYWENVSNMTFENEFVKRFLNEKFFEQCYKDLGK